MADWPDCATCGEKTIRSWDAGIPVYECASGHQTREGKPWKPPPLCEHEVDESIHSGGAIPVDVYVPCAKCNTYFLP